MVRTPTTATRAGLVDLLNPDPATINLRAMAHQLAQLNRYCGALDLPFSVAQHSVLTLEIFARRNTEMPGIYAVLHDAPEYVWGDYTRPSQEALDCVIPGFRRTLEGLHGRMHAAIRAHFRLPPPSIAILAAIKEADEIALATEWAAGMPHEAGPCPVSAKPLRGVRPNALPWVEAAAAFELNVRFQVEHFRAFYEEVAE
jgi:hypothetical protein